MKISENELRANFNMNNLIVFDVYEGVRPHVPIASELGGSFLIEN